MLGYVLKDTLKFGFLFGEFYIPYACAVWIIFGGPNKTTKFAGFNRYISLKFICMHDMCIIIRTY